METPINHHLRDRLIHIARAGDPATYSDVAPSAGIDLSTDWGWAQLGLELGRISRFEHEHGRPLLSAVVIQKNGDTPGPGFFNEARDAHTYHGKTKDDELTFWLEEFSRVRDYWQHHSS